VFSTPSQGGCSNLRQRAPYESEKELEHYAREVRPSLLLCLAPSMSVPCKSTMSGACADHVRRSGSGSGSEPEAEPEPEPELTNAKEIWNSFHELAFVCTSLAHCT
jgi:hypothetical protein